MVLFILSKMASFVPLFPQNSSEPIRVTLLSRGTKYRKILNEDEARNIDLLLLNGCSVF